MHRRIASYALAIGLASGAACSVPAHAADATTCGACFERTVERIGTSPEGRAINVVSRGRADADIDVVVVGQIHGNEPAGIAVVRALSSGVPPRRVRYWLIATLNPDGLRRRTRQNVRGVDLNRNFPFDWRGGGRAFDPFYPGPRAGSERETQALMMLIGRVRPDLTLWYHQHAALVDRPSGQWRIALASVYARWSRLPLRGGAFGRLHGTATSWQHHVQQRSAAFAVELPPGVLDATAVSRHADAARRTALAAAFDDVRSP